MRLSNIFEAQGQAPSLNPSSSTATVAGANAMRGVTHQSGTTVAKALGALGQGKTITPGLAKALDPYAEALTVILSDPQLRTKFVQLMKQAQKEEPAQDKETPTIKLTPGWGDGGRSMKANAGKLGGQQESVTEDQDSVDAVAGAITRRIMMQHVDLLSKYGPVKVMAAIDDVAEFAGSDGLDEIGSSDVSIWTKQVIQDLEAGHFDHVDEDADMNRVRKLAGLPTTEGSVDINYEVDPKFKKLVDVGHLLRKTLDTNSGVKWEDADFNNAAKLADALISLGSTFGPKNLKDALKLADMDIAQAQDLIAKASQKEESVDEAEGEDSVDTVTLDVPLMIRMLEYAREDAKDDMDLHDVAERMIAMSKDGPLSMDDYDSIVGSVEALPAPEEQPVEEGYYAPGPETMPGAVGPQETTTVSFNQSKQMGDATLNINASAKDMAELHRILKLAGIDYDSNSEEQEPEQDVAVAIAPQDAEAPAEAPCGCEDEEPADVKYSTDKQTLINVLRDKLQKRLA